MTKSQKRNNKAYRQAHMILQPKHNSVGKRKPKYLLNEIE